MSVTIDEVLVGDPPDAWTAAGFTVGDDGTCRIGQVRIRMVGRDGGKRILGWSLRGAPEGSLGDGTLDGLATTASSRAPGEPATHANGTLSLDHLVLLTPDLARTTAALGDLGVTPRGQRDADTYGAPMRQVFFRLGEVILEVVGQRDTPARATPGSSGWRSPSTTWRPPPSVLGPHLGVVKEAVQEGRRSRRCATATWA